MKFINLTQGRKAIVDDEEYQYLNQYKWCAWKSATGNTFYAVRNSPKDVNGERKRIWMHRIINETPEGMITDHVNGDGLDNRTANLRTCTNTDNVRNGRTPAHNTSGYKGVCFHKKAQKWKAQIQVNGKRIHLGLFTNPERAHRTYIAAAKKYHGEFIRSYNAI